MKFREFIFKALRYFVGSPNCRLGTYIVIHVVLIFVVVNRVKIYTREGSKMAQTAYELRTLISDREKWSQRSIWISQAVPRFIRHEDANKQLISLVNQAVREGEVRIRLNEVRHQYQNELTTSSAAVDEHFEKVAVELSFTGSEKEVVAFIHRLQSPANFVGVDHLAVDLTDYGDLSCELRVTQWFLPPWRQVENISFEPNAG